MKTLQSELTAYAISFASFVFPKLEYIKEVVLFGSVARGEADKNSDIDLFFNLDNEKNEKQVKATLKKQTEKFYKSKIFELWSLKGIKNFIKIHVGNLDRWKLKRSIISEGKILYSSYKEVPKDLKHFALFNIKPIKDIAKRNKIIRKLFGRKEENYSTTGILKEFNGKKISPTSFIVPAEHTQKIIKILGKEKIDYIFLEWWGERV